MLAASILHNFRNIIQSIVQCIFPHGNKTRKKKAVPLELTSPWGAHARVLHTVCALEGAESSVHWGEGAQHTDGGKCAVGVE